MSSTGAVPKLRKSFFWRISRAYFFLILFTAILLGFLILTTWTSFRDHTQQWNQWELAEVYATDLLPLLRATPPNEDEIRRKIFEIQEINPEVSVYILDAEAQPLYSQSAYTSLKRIDPAPLRVFLSHRGQLRTAIYGTDPTGVEDRVIFSVTRIDFQNIQGYLYVPLTSNKTSILGLMGREYSAIRSAILLVLSVVFLTFTLGLFVFSKLTSRLRRLTNTVYQFRQGELDARTDDTADDEIGVCAQTFNEMAEQIQSTLEALRHRDELRRGLISDIAHDLRRPVTLSRVALEQLGERISKLGPEAQQSAIIEVTNSFSGLSAMIDNFFELAKLEDISMKVKPTAFLLDELFEELYHQFRPFAHERGITFTIDLPDSELPAYADEHLIQRALANLVENGINYTREGGSVLLRATPLGGIIEVAVEDTGIGMTEEECVKVFDRFYRSAEAQKINSAGTGLGMAIVRRVVEAHGSTLHLKSAPGKGTKISFRLETPPS